MSAITDWTTAACAELGIDQPPDGHQQLVLDLARDVAHGVLRPAAPVTAYLLGLAVGQGADPATAAARLSALAGAGRRLSVGLRLERFQHWA